MRKIVLFQALLALFQSNLVAQVSVPYSTSTVQGSTIITNFSDPNAAGPGLPISPLDSRLNGPLLRNTDPTSITSQGPSASSPFTAIPSFTTLPATTTYSSTLAQPYVNQVVPTGVGNTFVQNPQTLQPGVYNNFANQGFGQLPPQSTYVPITTIKRDIPGNPEEPTYLFPGLVRYSIDKWVGSDYLYDLPSNIGVVVEVVSPTGSTQNINTALIKQNIEAIFSYARINPVTESFQGQPPLPFFHLLIFAVPVENSYVFSISGRLFEAVRLARLNLRLPGTWQAITWEKQELIVASKTLFFEQLLATSKEIAEFFTQRVTYFKKQRMELEEQLRLRCGPRVINDPFAPKKMTEAEAKKYDQESNYDQKCGWSCGSCR